MNRLFFALSFFWVGNLLWCQNLLVNGSFEQITNCPTHFSQLSELVYGIEVPTNGTSDIYAACNDEKFGTPLNVKGYQKPKEGNNYVGFYLYAPKNYREYLQIPIQPGITPDGFYRLTFYLSYAESSNFPVEDIEVYLVSKKVSFFSTQPLDYQELKKGRGQKVRKLDLQILGDMTNPEEWVEIVADFQADGFENYLVVGNFKWNKNTNMPTEHQGKTGFSYYFFDDFSLLEKATESYAYEKNYVLDRVHFKHDSFEIEGRSISQLDELYLTLSELENIELKIHGHTNDLGSDSHNAFLSYQRAKAVANYLVAKGFPRDRIAFEGFGSSQPMIPAMSEEARKLNRRVEFAITKFEE